MTSVNMNRFRLYLFRLRAAFSNSCGGLQPSAATMKSFKSRQKCELLLFVLFFKVKFKTFYYFFCRILFSGNNCWNVLGPSQKYEPLLFVLFFEISQFFSKMNKFLTQKFFGDIFLGNILFGEQFIWEYVLGSS